VELLTVIASQSTHSTPSRPEQAPFKAKFLSLTQNFKSTVCYHKCIAMSAFNSLWSWTSLYKCWQLSLGWESRKFLSCLFQSVSQMHHNEHIRLPWVIERIPLTVFALNSYTNEDLLKTNKHLLQVPSYTHTSTLVVMSCTVVSQSKLLCVYTCFRHRSH